MKNIKLLKPAVTLLVSAWAFSATAIPVTTDGIWTAVSGNPSGTTAGIGTNNVQWGAPFGSSTAGQSGYIFDGVNGDAPLDGTLFELGDFTHENFTISLPSIETASLSLGLNFTGESVLQDFSFVFVHTETPNNPSSGICAEGGVAPCPDLVSIPDASSSETVTLQGDEYLLEILGFSEDGGVTTTASFLTLEGQPNTATLYARLILVEQPVPEPTTLALMAIGLLGAGLRRKQV